MKSPTGGERFVLICVLLFILWQGFEAVWLGRVYDLMFSEDWVFFFEDPVIFGIQAVAYAVVGIFVAARLAQNQLRGLFQRWK